VRATVHVVQDFEVIVPDILLTEEFMAEFRKSFYGFTTKEQHIKHLAQLHARGLADDDSFIEGYGKGVGIKFLFPSIEVREVEVTG
jgi:hypothetical protein